MSKQQRSLSATRSRSPREPSAQHGRNIPDLFRAPQVLQEEAAHHTQALPRSIGSSSHRDTASASIQGAMPPPPALCISDLQVVAADIKTTLTAAIADLRMDIQNIASRVDKVEEAYKRHDTSLCHVQQITESHAIHLRELNRHVEDLDNRGRRHNLRVRGLPESFEHNQLSTAISAIFNELLGRSPEAPIHMDRVHRALRPRNRDTDPPRDVICCLANFMLKEDILRNSRLRNRIIYQGADIKIFQDLSSITLQRRRELRPLLDSLRNREISYRWKFPFGLSATFQGRTALLRVPEDLDHFCNSLEIPTIELPDWYSDFRLPPMHRISSMEDINEGDNFSIRRRRGHPPSHGSVSNDAMPRNGSPTASPAHRRARHSP